MSKDNLLKHAIKSKETFKNFYSMHDKLKMFHIRPTSKGVTVVTTHEELAMRGIEVSISNLEKLLKKLACAVADDDKKWYKCFEYEGKRFKDRSKESRDKKKEREFHHQAKFINEIIYNSKAFSKKLNEELFFLGSELIFQEGRKEKWERIDVVAHNGRGKVLFFELKDSQNNKSKPHDQVKRYIGKYYNDGDFKNFLKHYPTIKSIEDDMCITFEGWVVIGDEKKPHFEFEKAVSHNAIDEDIYCPH